MRILITLTSTKAAWLVKSDTVSRQVKNENFLLSVSLWDWLEIEERNIEMG